MEHLMFVPVRLAVLVLALALTSCSQPAPSADTPTPTPTVVSVCSGVTGCRPVATVDVDGDGAPDQVGVVAQDTTSAGSITVRVRTAAGESLQTTGRDVYWFSDPFLGAVPLDGRAGAEIVVGSTMGANFQQFRVVTYRSGRLVTLPAPPAVWSSEGMKRSTSRWGVDGSYRFNVGIFRAQSTDGVTVTMKTLERNASGHGHSGHVTRYRWRSDGWVKVSATTVRSVTDQTAFASGGWHVTGLRRFG
jgi:hypothetical protein